MKQRTKHRIDRMAESLAEIERYRSVLSKRYLLGALFFIGLIVIAGTLIISVSMNRITDAHFLRFANQQRAYSERMVALALSIQAETNTEKQSGLVAELRDTSNRWARVQVGLRAGDASFDLPETKSPSVIAQLAGAESSVRAFQLDVEALLASIDHPDAELQPAFFHQLRGDELAYSEKMDRIVTTHENEMITRAVERRTYSLLIVGAGLLLFFLQWVLIIRPAIRGIEASIKKMKEESGFRLGVQRETERFKLAVENASEHIIITDADAMILYANPAAERITGFTLREMIGRKAGSSDLWGGQMDPAFYRRLWKTLKTEKKPFRGELTNRRKRGDTYIAQSSISPILDESGEVEYFVALERDITREKEIDRVKTEFVSLASHQLRTPLSSVKWYAELLEEEQAGPLSEKQQGYLREIKNGNQRMIRLVNALLNVSRLELGTFVNEPESIQLRSFLEALLESLKGYLPDRGVRIALQISSVSTVQADPSILRMIFENLLTNGIKYSKSNGEVTLTVQMQKAGAIVDGRPCVQDSLQIEVRDDGIEILIHEQDKVFTKLFRGENARAAVSNGNGLGLYLVKSIVDQMHGDIWFHSGEGHGTVFFVVLPLEGLGTATKRHEKDNTV